MELTIEYLAPYLPYSLPLQRENVSGFMRIIHMNNGNIMLPIERSDICKPIVRPISDLFNDKLNPVPINEFKNIYGWDYLFLNVYKKKEPFNINALKWGVLKQLFKQHFDVFGLIEKGLAIDINTLSITNAKN